MFYLERMDKKGEGDIQVELLEDGVEDGKGFGTHEEAWAVKGQCYADQTNVVVTWYASPPTPKNKAT